MRPRQTVTAGESEIRVAKYERKIGREMCFSFAMTFVDESSLAQTVGVLLELCLFGLNA